MISALVIASHVILPSQAPAPMPEPVAVMTEVKVEAQAEVKVKRAEPTPSAPAQAGDEHAWPTTGVVTFEDGSWRNMDTGETGCNPGNLCGGNAPVECGDGLALAEDGSCVPETFWDDMPERYAPTFGYGPCATEDATACYWDASVQGNGIGSSFVVHADGTVIYWED